MKWYWVWASEYDVKNHLIPEFLLEGILKNLHSRGASKMLKKCVAHDRPVSFDLPGMAWAHRHMCKVQLNGVTLEIPATDVGAILERTKSLKLRNDAGKPYYKLHGFKRCICLEQEQKDQLEKALEAILPEAERIANEENKRFNEAMCGPKARSKYIAAKPRPVKEEKDE